MSTAKTWPNPAGGTPTATSYSIPAAGELNWASLSAFLIALGDGAQGTTFQMFANRKATTSPVTVAVTDCIVGSKLAAPGAVTVNLPAGVHKQTFMIFDDTGDATTNNVTINRAGSDTIAGATSYVISVNRGWVILCYNSSDTDWKIVASSLNSGASIVKPVITGITSGSSAASGIVGEVLVQSRLKSASTGLTTATAKNVTATPLTLTAGDWEISGMVALEGTSATATLARVAISTTSATIPANDTICVPTTGEVRMQRTYNYVTTSFVESVSIPPYQVTISSDTIYYLVAEITYSAGSSLLTFGSIRARRVR